MASSSVTHKPINRSLCPPMNFVPLCNTMAAPCSSGRCSSGVANVESTTIRAPASRHAAAIAGRSATSSVGFVGVSTHTTSAPVRRGRYLRGVGDVDGPQLDMTLHLVLGEQRADTEVAERRDHHDLRHQRVDDRRRRGHPARERDCAPTLQRADRGFEGRPRLGAMRAGVVAAATEVRRQDDRLVQRIAVRRRPARRDGNGCG